MIRRTRLAESIKMYLKVYNIPQKTLSEETGIQSSTLCKFFRGEGISLTTYKQLEKWLLLPHDASQSH